MSVAKISPLPKTEMDALLLGRLDELTVSCESNSKAKNYLSILISILVLLMISSMIVAAIVIINPDITSIPSKLFTTREAISLEESMLGELSPNDFPCYWLQPQQEHTVSSEQDSATTTRQSNDQPMIPPNDELIFEDSKNLNLLTIPSVDEQANDSNNNKSFQINYGTFFNNFKPKLTTLISNTSLISSIEIQGYKISPSKRYLLIWISRKKQFRYSSTAKYFLYDIKLDLISILSTNQQTIGDTSKQQQQQVNFYENLDSASQFLNYYDEGNQFTRFQLVDWIQNNANPSQESLVLIQNNDIYLLNLNTNQEINSPIRLTFTGKLGEIFNGIPDWLYEEEILSDTPAYQVSQKADTLAYMSFNDSLVDVMAFTVYGSSEQILPKAQRIRYPKAGRVNPIVSVHLIVDLNNINNERHDIKLELPIDLSTQQHYINRIRWLNNDKLALIWLNRNQNESYIVICSRNNNWECEKNLHLKARNGWLDMSDDLYPLNNDHYLAIILKHEGDDVGSFKHIAKVFMKEKDSFFYLTKGKKEVLNINGIDEKKSVVYYTSTVKNEPGQRQLFWANLNGDNPKQDDSTPFQSEDDKNDRDRCITCAHYPDECLFNYVKMSPSTKNYIFECLGPGIPRIELRSIPSNKQSTNDNKNNNFDNNNPQLRLLRPSLTLSEKSLELSNNFDSDTTQEQFKSSSLKSNNFPTTTITSNKLAPTFSGVVQNYPNNNNNNKQATPIVDSTLLWTIENNQALKDKLTNNKAMPLTMRLKVPITNTSYFANVIMLLPPQLGPTNTFRALKSVNNLVSSNSNLRTSRSAILSGSSNSIEQALHAHFTPDSISEYTNKLTSIQKYPMVVDVYAGPGSQRVDYRFHINFGHYLASSRRIIYVMIDGRGSGYEGTKRLYELYHKFGTVEIDDQIEVAAYLTRNYSFIDPNKVAIWGWSYGGYAAAMALAKSNSRALRNIQDKLNYTTNNSKLNWSNQQQQQQQHLYSLLTDQSRANSLSLLQNNDVTNKQTNINYSPIKGVFECAISVAPVTNWIYYDTTYTERFMSSPYLNEQYDNIQPNDHLINSSSSSNLNNNDNKVSSDDDRISSNLHGHLQPAEDEQKQNFLSTIDRLTTSKWKPLNKTIGTHSSLTDLVIQSSSLPLAQQQKQPLPSSTSPLTQTTISRDKINSFDLNERYRAASLLEQIGNIDKKRFLLVHGTADDNVHFQQSIMLMKRLIQKNIMYETRLYPDQDHSIANKADKIHLGSTLSNFFSECFDMAY